MIQIGGVYTTFCQKKKAYLCKNIAIKMGGVSRYFSQVSGSGVDLTLTNLIVQFGPAILLCVMVMDLMVLLMA